MSVFAYFAIRFPRGRSDCVENALLVTDATDSMSLSKSTKPNGSLSLSGERDRLGREWVARSLSLSPLYRRSQPEPVLLYVCMYFIRCRFFSSRSWATRSCRARAKA